MKQYLFLFTSSLEDLRRNKIRTFLTSLGILIGVFSVVLLIAFGIGLKNYIQKQFESLGANLVYVMPGKVISSGGGFSNSSRALAPRFDEKDLARLKKLKDANFVVPVYTLNPSVIAGKNSEDTQVIGTDQEVVAAINLKADLGSFFTKSDVEKRAKKAILGPEIAKKLFGSKDNALGKKIRIKNETFTVTGVLVSKGGGALGGPNFDSIVYTPYKSGLDPEKKFFTFYIQAKSQDAIPTLKQEINRELSKRYKDDEYQVIEQTEILGIVTSIFAILNTILIAIGSISLVVGGIGIMNIMYATVTERIKEIGIRRAIGATKKDILFQFLTQALILSVIGGLLGLLFAFAVVIVIQPFFPAGINLLSVIAALGISSFIGIFFGVFPARNAANLSPIDAIRYE